MKVKDFFLKVLRWFIPIAGFLMAVVQLTPMWMVLLVAGLLSIVLAGSEVTI